ncbi:hypothetical protein CEXT_238251 [Caerostris extrusa]|uniref:Uncharacterized protein n=1 Tax=Caerostris extrusa TaxID=172846 RepID=A0AAV4N0S2_CAEEX|nr:hypothetical protein CEXT_238251 [Caerostris extrusa]
MFSFYIASPNPDINRSPALTHPRFILLGDRLFATIYLSVWGRIWHRYQRKIRPIISVHQSSSWLLDVDKAKRWGHPPPFVLFFILFHPFSEGYTVMNDTRARS